MLAGLSQNWKVSLPFRKGPLTRFRFCQVSAWPSTSSKEAPLHPRTYQNLMAVVRVHHRPRFRRAIISNKARNKASGARIYFSRRNINARHFNDTRGDRSSSTDGITELISLGNVKDTRMNNTEDDTPLGPYNPSVHVQFLVKSYCDMSSIVLSVENDKPYTHVLQPDSRLRGFLKLSNDWNEHQPGYNKL